MIIFRCIAFTLKACALFLFAFTAGPFVHAFGSLEFRSRFAIFLLDQCDRLDAESDALGKELDKL